MTLSNIEKTTELGVQFWNDSCCPKELGEALQFGAVGATSNPVIVQNVVEGDPERWMPVLEQLCKDFPIESETEIAWRLVKRVGSDAAALLEPAYQKHQGRMGRLSIQVNPQYYPNRENMLEHARELSAIAPNIAIKAPATDAGLLAMEDMTANGISVNATVSFSVPQAVAAAETIASGLEKAKAAGINTDEMQPVVTIMVGRVEDQIKRAVEKDRLDINPDLLSWSGVAVFKAAYKLFQERGYRATLLAAAYRNQIQWTELIGENLIQTIPYKWWKKFNDSDITPRRSIDLPVDQEIIQTLMKIDDFRRAYDEKGMERSDFVHYGASIHTLNQFLNGYQSLLEIVRGKMLI